MMLLEFAYDGLKTTRVLNIFAEFDFLAIRLNWRKQLLTHVRHSFYDEHWRFQSPLLIRIPLGKGTYFESRDIRKIKKYSNEFKE